MLRVASSRCLHPGGFPAPLILLPGLILPWNGAGCVRAPRAALSQGPISLLQQPAAIVGKPGAAGAGAAGSLHHRGGKVGSPLFLPLPHIQRCPWARAGVLSTLGEGKGVPCSSRCIPASPLAPGDAALAPGSPDGVGLGLAAVGQPQAGSEREMFVFWWWWRLWFWHGEGARSSS